MAGPVSSGVLMHLGNSGNNFWWKVSLTKIIPSNLKVLLACVGNITQRPPNDDIILIYAVT
jgi:hypothetical protein